MMGPFGPNPLMMQWLPVPAFPSLCSVLSETAVEHPSGQTTFDFLISSDPNLVDMSCRTTPLIEQRPSGGELVGPITTTVTNEEMLALNTYRPEIEEKDRLIVDGVEYDIIKIEHDGNRAYTRIRILRRIP